MKPRDIVIANLDRADPPRIGMDFSGGRWNDMAYAGLDPPRGRAARRWEEGTFEYYDDEWGNVWRRMIGMSAGGEIDVPALRDWSMLGSFRLPDLAEAYRYVSATKVFSLEQDRLRVGFLPGFPFAICRYLRKMEVYFQDLVWERRNIDELHARVTDLLEAMIARWADSGADAIIFCEDWGVQNRLLISPRMWRSIFKPLFVRLCGAARSRGLRVVMHSCGYVWDILDDLAEVGVSAMQFDQPAIYGLGRLADRLARNGMALHAPVDIQATMPTGDRNRIEGEARAMVDLFGGAFIAKNYGDLHGIGVQPEWDEWAYRIFERAASSAMAAGEVAE